MASSHRFAVMLVIESNDPILSEDQIEAALRTPAGVARMRRHVLASLPGSIQRLVAVFPEEHAKMLMLLHEAVGEDLTGEALFVHPPEGYIPPTRD
jgi:uncharacterized Zn finger protein